MNVRSKFNRSLAEFLQQVSRQAVADFDLAPGKVGRGHGDVFNGAFISSCNPSQGHTIPLPMS
jgi:hypothetical protein